LVLVNLHEISLSNRWICNVLLGQPHWEAAPDKALRLYHAASRQTFNWLTSAALTPHFFVLFGDNHV
jgi:hypothetical protein